MFGEVDTQCEKELTVACIPMERAEFLREKREVPTALLGQLDLWSFRRAWYYWVAEGPGVPADKAEEFHKSYGTQCRVNGHCGCPSPLEQNHGFGIGMYHIDTQEGLNAFAQLLKSIYIEKKGEELPDFRALHLRETEAIKQLKEAKEKLARAREKMIDKVIDPLIEKMIDEGYLPRPVEGFKVEYKEGENASS